MRIWDIKSKYLCNKHLVAEHAELHSLWSIINKQKKGFSRHPETERWRGKLKALYQRHEELVKEMVKRGFRHQSPLDKRQARGKARQDFYLDSPRKQRDTEKETLPVSFRKINEKINSGLVFLDWIE